jgi:16S rRNA processing protein RimM
LADILAVTIAKIIKPQGNRGEVAAEILTDFPERFGAVQQISLRQEGKPEVQLRLSNFWFHKGRVILQFEGIDSIQAAEGLRGYELRVPREEAVPLPEGGYYHFDLIGCIVKDGLGHEYGEVVEVLPMGESTLLSIRHQGGEFMVPFAEVFFPRIDVRNKELIASFPEGLTEL